MVPGHAVPDDRYVEGIANVTHRSRVIRKAACGLAFLLPLLVVPGWEQPFSRPKLIVWAAVVLCGMCGVSGAIWTSVARLPKSLGSALTVWVAAVSYSTLVGRFASLDILLLALTGAGWFVLLVAVQPIARHFSWMLVISGSIVAGIALSQFLGADPFSAAGWIPAACGNARMRVFTTLGNPDFAAAFLAGLLPLTFSLATETARKRWLAFALFALQGSAILATGSRAPILGITAAALWLCWLRTRKMTVAFCAIVACMIFLVATISPARSITTTLKGRLYIWKVSAPHLTEHLVTGLGAGGFGASFSAWETEYWRGIPNHDERMFAGIEDHAHNDYLEIFADYGALGLFGLASILVLFLRTVAKHRREIDPALVGASAGVVALAAVALVDFPLARPAEVFLFWSLIAVSCLGAHQRRDRTGI